MARDPLTELILSHLTPGLCVQVLQKVQSALVTFVKENYSTEESMSFLYSITGEDEAARDLRVKQDMYQAVHSVLATVEPAELSSVFNKELRAMFPENEEKAISLVYNADSFLQYWERMCFYKIQRTGILELEFTPTERQSSSFYLLLKYRLENPSKYKEYHENYQKIADYLTSVYNKISKQGSIQVHADYLQPLIDKGL